MQTEDTGFKARILHLYEPYQNLNYFNLYCIKCPQTGTGECSIRL